jgi:mono/diheme cytochrome c family protein
MATSRVSALTGIAVVLGAILGLAGARAAGEHDEPEALAPGALVRLTHHAVGGVEAIREAAVLSWDFGDGSPDARIPAIGFRLSASGLLLVQAPGTYRFFARGESPVVLRVDGRVACEGAGAGRRSPPLQLNPGFASLELEARRGAGTARLAIDWEGPGFAREPLPARLLFHDPTKAPPTDVFEQGRRLADRLGCANCHSVLDLPRHNSLGPPLDAARAVDSEWLVAWLKNPPAVRPSTRMPAFGPGLSDAIAADLAAYLSEVSSKGPNVTAELRMALNVASSETGRVLFRSLGCLACHGRGESPGSALPVGPDLADLGKKRTVAAVAAYLEHSRSGKVPSRHRPDLRLTADESASLAAYLTGGTEPMRGALHVNGNAQRGREHADRFRCASCHVIPRLEPRTADSPLRAGSNAEGGCLGAESGRDQPNIPRFALTAAQRDALRAFVAGLPRNPSAPTPETRALDSMARLNCFGCHARNGRSSLDLASRLAPLLAEDPALGSLKGRITPPDLTAVGDKLRPSYLAAAIQGKAPSARPWLAVRMPVFTFEPAEADAIASFFRSHDRLSLETETITEGRRARLDPPLRRVAARLIGQRGFGCASCHVLVGRIPPGGEPETLGPDLALAHQRMTEQYFHRWIADPQRIIAGTPMPQYLKPIEGVPGTLDDQLDTIWQLLGSETLAEVAATGTREILMREGSRALVVSDMVLVPGLPDTPYTPRGLAIGLVNGASLLFDTDRLTWLAWWHKGFMFRTKAGRLWEWHPEGRILWTAPKRVSPVVLVAADGSVTAPQDLRERFGSFRRIEFVGAGVQLSYRLNFGSKMLIDVDEEIQPQDSGWARSVRVGRVSPGFTPRLVLQPPPRAEIIEGGNGVRWPAGDVRARLRWGEERPDPPADPGTGELVLIPFHSARSGGSSAHVELSLGAGP